MLVFRVKLTNFPKLHHLGIPKYLLQVDVQDLEELLPVLICWKIGKIELFGWLNDAFAFIVILLISEMYFSGGGDFNLFESPKHLPFVGEVAILIF